MFAPTSTSQVPVCHTPTSLSTSNGIPSPSALHTHSHSSSGQAVVHAHCWTGMTFVTEAIQRCLQPQNENIVYVSMSAGAFGLMLQRLTLHPIFKIPVPCRGSNCSTIPAIVQLATNIRNDDLFTCDEVLMCELLHGFRRSPNVISYQKSESPRRKRPTVLWILSTYPSCHPRLFECQFFHACVKTSSL